MTLELYFLGQCLWDPSIAMTTRLVPEDFENGRERNIFKAILDITNRGEVIDEANVASECGMQIGDIMALKNVDILASTWQSTELLIKKRSKVRKVKEVASQILNSSTDDPNQLEAILIGAVDQYISYSDSNELITFQDSIIMTMNEVRDRVYREDKIIGTPSGIRRLDEYLGGFQKRQLYVIGARPSQGKTALLLNFIANCNRPSGLLSAESAVQELSFRLLARESRCEAQRLIMGSISEAMLCDLDGLAAKLYDEKKIVFYDEPRMTVDVAIRKAREMKMKYDISILFVDYLQFFAPSGDMTRKDTREHVADVSSKLKQLARTLDIPVVVAAQLRRDAEGKRPLLSDFSDSTQIERDADVCIFIHHVEDASAKYPGSWLLIEKNRNGRCGDIPVYFDRECLLFTDRAV
jgi:replicative DNA helicase